MYEQTLVLVYVTVGVVGVALVTAKETVGPAVTHFAALTVIVPATLTAITAFAVPCPDLIEFPVPVTAQVYV